MAKGITIIYAGERGDSTLMIAPPEAVERGSREWLDDERKRARANATLGDRHCFKRPLVIAGSPQADREAAERNAHVHEAVRRVINAWSGS